MCPSYKMQYRMQSKRLAELALIVCAHLVNRAHL